MDHILCRIGADRFASSPGCKVSSSVLLPALMLTANLGDLGAAVPLVDRAESRARFERRQLLRVATENDLGAGMDCGAGQIGREQNRERGCTYESISVLAGSTQKTKTKN